MESRADAEAALDLENRLWWCLYGVDKLPGVCKVIASEKRNPEDPVMSNLPPGVTTSMLPGNDAAAERWHAVSATIDKWHECPRCGRPLHAERGEPTSDSAAGLAPYIAYDHDTGELRCRYAPEDFESLAFVQSEALTAWIAMRDNRESDAGDLYMAEERLRGAHALIQNDRCDTVLLKGV